MDVIKASRRPAAQYNHGRHQSFQTPCSTIQPRTSSKLPDAMQHNTAKVLILHWGEEKHSDG